MGGQVYDRATVEKMAAKGDDMFSGRTQHRTAPYLQHCGAAARAPAVLSPAEDEVEQCTVWERGIHRGELVTKRLHPILPARRG